MQDSGVFGDVGVRPEARQPSEWFSPADAGQTKVLLGGGYKSGQSSEGAAANVIQVVSEKTKAFHRTFLPAQKL